MFGIAADFGLFTIGVREMAANEDRMGKIIGNILGMRFVLAIVVLSIAVVAGTFVYPNDPDIVYGIMIGSAATFIALMQGTISSVLQVRLKMQYVSMFHVIGKLTQVIYIALVAFVLFADKTSSGFYHLLAAGIVANGTMLIGCWYFARKEVSIHMYFDFEYWIEMAKKALPYGFALALATIYLRIDSFMLSKMVGKAEVGYYAVAVRVLEAFRILPLYFMNSTLPSLTRAIQKKDGSHTKIIQYSIEFMVALSLPILVGGSLLAFNIVALVSSPNYLSRVSEGFYGSDIALQILLLEVVFSFLNAIFIFTLIAMHKQGKTIWINGGAAILNVALNFTLIPYFGFRGAGATTVLSEAFVLLVAVWMVKHYLKFKVQFNNIFKIILSAAVMGAVVFIGKLILESLVASNLIVISVLVPVGGLVYVAMLLGTKAVTKNMLKMLRKNEK